MTIDRDKAKVFQAKLNDALSTLARENELTVRSGTLRFDESSMRVTMTFTVRRSDAELAAAKKKEWYVHCPFVGLAPEDFGKTITMDGERFTVTGLNLKSKRNLVELRRVRDGKVFRCSADALRIALRLADARGGPINAGAILTEGLAKVSSDASEELSE